MFKRLLSFIFINALFVSGLGIAHEFDELWGNKGSVQEVGKLMDYVVVTGTRWRMNAKTAVVDSAGKARTRGSIKPGQEVRVYFKIDQPPNKPPMLNKVHIVGGLQNGE